jgi:hypothetical protein
MLRILQGFFSWIEFLTLRFGEVSFTVMLTGQTTGRPFSTHLETFFPILYGVLFDHVTTLLKEKFCFPQ